MLESGEDRRRFLHGLDRAERSVVAFFRAFLGLLLLGVVGFVAWVLLQRPFANSHQGEAFYFALAVVLVVGWILPQMARLRRRRR